MEHHRHLDMRRYDGNDFDMAAYLNWHMQFEANQPGMLPSTQYHDGLFVKGKHELWPIPQGQIDKSEDENGITVLVQNPGWGK